MDRKLLIALGCAFLFLIVGTAFVVHFASTQRDLLIPRHLHNTIFEPPPPNPGVGQVIATAWSDLKGEPGAGFLHSMLPTQAGVLWIALIVALVVAFDYSRPASARNFVFLALMAIGFLLFNIMRFFDYLTDPTYFWVMDYVYRAIMAINLFLVSVAVWRVRRGSAETWRPNLPVRALITLNGGLVQPRRLHRHGHPA